jgi:hypothetical protein
MPNPNSNGENQSQNFSSKMVNPRIPTYLPLPDAAKKFGLSEKVLTRHIQAGKIEAVQLPSGELLVAAQNNGQDEPRTKEEIIAAEFDHLRENSISASEASRKYSDRYGVPISPQIFSSWAKSGQITVRGRGYRLELDEAEVAYCAKIYAEKYHEYQGQLQGVRVFDENGNPYQLKYREVAEQMRTERRARKDQPEEI